MPLQETICCATAPPPSSSSNQGVVAVHDIQTGATLASFKQTSAGPQCTVVLESDSTRGGYILAAQPEKSILNVYTFQKDQINLKIVLPEKLSCIAIDRRGNYCAGGTAQGRIYLWELGSGILYNVWDAHYRKVNALKFTTDGAALVSVSDDSGVSVWAVSRLLDEDLQMELPIPYCTFSDHTLPVTDIICGVGVFPNCRILTSSVDHSVKLWDLSSQKLLTTFQFPQPILNLVWDVTERIFFASSEDGSIHQINLFSQRESKFGGKILEAVGGAGVNDVIPICDEDTENRQKRLISVGQPVTSLSISLTSTLLLVGTSEGLIHVYDIPSHQLLRTISTHKGFSISYLSTMLKPPDLVGHVSLSFNVGTAADAKDVIPVKPVMPFHRMKDNKAREAHDVTMILPRNTNSRIDEYSSYSMEELLQDHAYFVAPTASTSSNADPVSLKSKVDELESEVAYLREQLGKAKGVNDAMWDAVIQRLVNRDKIAGDDMGDILSGGDPGEK